MRANLTRSRSFYCERTWPSPKAERRPSPITTHLPAPAASPGQGIFRANHCSRILPQPSPDPLNPRSTVPAWTLVHTRLAAFHHGMQQSLHIQETLICFGGSLGRSRGVSMYRSARTADYFVGSEVFFVCLATMGEGGSTQGGHGFGLPQEPFVYLLAH